MASDSLGREYDVDPSSVGLIPGGCVAGCSCTPDSDGNEEEDIGPPHGLVDSEDEEDVPDTPMHLLSAREAKRREVRLERERDEERRRPFLEAIDAHNAEIDRQIDAESDAIKKTYFSPSSF